MKNYCIFKFRAEKLIIYNNIADIIIFLKKVAVKIIFLLH